MSGSRAQKVDCDLYWGDSEGQFSRGAGCRAESDCVLPGENGTVFIGGHTGSYFSDLGSTQIGSIIHLETDWGDFTYQVTDMQVILETDIDKVRLNATEPSVILYTCYPFGILTHTHPLRGLCGPCRRRRVRRHPRRIHRRINQKRGSTHPGEASLFWCE